MTITTIMLTHAETLGPLTGQQRRTIMHHAAGMLPSARRTFRRLLILAQPRGLDDALIARTAVQAHEHDTA